MRPALPAFAFLALTIAAPALAQAYDTPSGALLLSLSVPAGPNGAVRANQLFDGSRPYALPGAPAPDRSTGIFAQHETASWLDLTKAKAPTPQP